MKSFLTACKDFFLLFCIGLAWLAWAAFHARDIANECEALDASERGLA